jgi:hypothetical protein
MPTMSDVKFDSLYCLFKGEPGTRKSTCALSFPKPQYWLSYDMKMDALMLPMRQWNITPKQIEYDDYTDWDKARVKLERFLVSCPYKTAIIDSITSNADAINRQTLKVKGADAQGKRVAGIPVNSIEDYSAEESALKEMVALTKEICRSHGVNIILIAHIIQKEMKSSDGKTHMSRVLLTAGKGIAQKIPAYCSEVYHFNIKESAIVGMGGKYALLTTHTGDDFARTSLPLDDEIVFGNDPLYDKWILPAIQKMRPPVSSVVPSQQPTTTNQPTPFVKG